MSDQLEKLIQARSELESQLTRSAWADNDFRRRFIADPKGEIAKRFGKALPDSLRITVHEEDANHLHLVIPAKPDPNAELSDEDLEKVAGGTVGMAIVGLVGLIGMVGAMTWGNAHVAQADASAGRKKSGW